MYITQEADYAVRIVYCLAKHGKRCDARTISEEMSVTLRFSLKILGKLSTAGIVKSFKGNRGGYELAREAVEISLKEVLSAVEGPYSMSRCLCENECNRGALNQCAFQRVLARISNDINSQLEEVSFLHLLEDTAPGDADYALQA